MNIKKWKVENSIKARKSAESFLIDMRIAIRLFKTHGQLSSRLRRREIGAHAAVRVNAGTVVVHQHGNWTVAFVLSSTAL